MRCNSRREQIVRTLKLEIITWKQEKIKVFKDVYTIVKNLFEQKKI